MKSIILSIKLKWWSQIKFGQKTIELRRVIPKQPFDQILFYCSFPVQRLVGVADVEGIKELPKDPQLLRYWRNENRNSHFISFSEFDSYAPKYAIYLKLKHVFKTP